MNAKDAFLSNMDLGERVMSAYLNGLTDADLLVAPVAGMNPIAWQLGHLIASESSLLNAVTPGASPALPAGFAEAHGKDAAASSDTSKYLGLDEYLRLFKVQREATKAAVAALAEADFDKPSPPPMAGRFPTVGSIVGLIGSHVMMHAGQWVAVRRHLGKPVAI